MESIVEENNQSGDNCDVKDRKLINDKQSECDKTNGTIKSIVKN